MSEEEVTKLNNDGKRELKEQYYFHRWDRIKNINEKIEDIKYFINTIGLTTLKVFNVATLLNNKILEIKRTFEVNGLSFFDSEDKEENGESNIIEEAILDELFGKFDEAIDKLDKYIQRIKEVCENKIGFMLFLRPNKKDKDELESLLQEYVNLCNKIFDFKLAYNLVDALVEEIAGSDERNGQLIKHSFSKEKAIELLEASIKPDLKKLGLECLIPELERKLNEAYREDNFVVGVEELAGNYDRIPVEERITAGKIPSDKKSSIIK